MLGAKKGHVSFLSAVSQAYFVMCYLRASARSTITSKEVIEHYSPTIMPTSIFLKHCLVTMVFKMVVYHIDTNWGK